MDKRGRIFIDTDDEQVNYEDLSKTSGWALFIQSNVIALSYRTPNTTNLGPVTVMNKDLKKLSKLENTQNIKIKKVQL